MDAGRPACLVGRDSSLNRDCIDYLDYILMVLRQVFGLFWIHFGECRFESLRGHRRHHRRASLPLTVEARTTLADGVSRPQHTASAAIGAAPVERSHVRSG